jgi:hypothetical protein
MPGSELSLYFRQILQSVVGITKSLNEEGIKASRSAVNLFICRFRKTEILHDAAFIVIDAATPQLLSFLLAVIL